MILNNRKSEVLGARVRALVEEGLARKKVSARKASIEVVGHDGLVRDIRAGRVPSFDRLVALFEYLSIPISFGGKPAAPVVTLKEPPIAPGVEGREGFLPVQWHSESSRCGAGPFAISIEMIRQKNLATDALFFISPDQSLLSNVGSESHALLDVSAKRQAEPAPWCFVEANRIILARLHWQDDGLTVISGDAQGAQLRVLTPAAAATIRPLGRIVWLGTAF